MTDTTTTLLRQTEAREAEREELQALTHSNVVAEWDANPEDTARRILVSAGITDEFLLISIAAIATNRSAMNSPTKATRAVLQWYEVDQRMGEDDD